MDPMLVEFAKYGPLVLAFGVLLYKSLQSQDRFASEARDDKQKLMELVANNTSAMREASAASRSLKAALERRPCLLDDAALREGGGGDAA